MWIDSSSEVFGLCHEICGAVAGGAIRAVCLWHEAATLMLFVAGGAGVFRGHVWLMEIFSHMARQALGIHRTGFERARLDQFRRRQIVPERIEGLVMPSGAPQCCAFMARGAFAGITRECHVGFGEMLARVDAGNRARI